MFNNYPDGMDQYDFKAMDGTYNCEDSSRDYYYDEDYNNNTELANLLEGDEIFGYEEDLKEKKEQITLDTISKVYKERNWKSFKDVDEDYLYARINEALEKEGLKSYV